jgi:hypothetical protein
MYNSGLTQALFKFLLELITYLVKELSTVALPNVIK